VGIPVLISNLAPQKDRWPMTYKVPKYNYAAQFSGLREELLPAIENLLTEGGYVRGPQVGDFECRLAGFIGTRHVVGVNSGTDALTLALKALDIGPGDEVITVANTWHSTALAIERLGAKAVLVDCEEETYLIGLDAAERAITPATRAVIVVHLYGQSVDMDKARSLCKANDLYLIEDCAQAIGARWGASRVGSLGDVGCWSFAPAKNLAAAGDAGAVSTDDEALAERVSLLGNFGQPRQNEHVLLGYNSRLDSIQAIVLAHKLNHVDRWNAERVRIARSYRSALQHLPVRFQGGAYPGGHVYHLFQVRVAAEQRDSMVEYLRNQGIDAVVRYPVPLHLQPAFRHLLIQPGSFPVAEALSRETLCLPIRPDLSDNEVEYVTQAVSRFFGR
jgi:dTDP-4-amino-4,6-dideoxygalactose transaminase